MKKIFLISGIFLLLSSVFAMSLNSGEKSVKVTGYIKSYGNDPFAFPGFETEKGKHYTIICNDTEKKTFLNLQGNLLRVEGIITKQNEDENSSHYNMLEDGFIEINDYEIINK